MPGSQREKDPLVDRTPISPSISHLLLLLAIGTWLYLLLRTLFLLHWRRVVGPHGLNKSGDLEISDKRSFRKEATSQGESNSSLRGPSRTFQQGVNSLSQGRSKDAFDCFQGLGRQGYRVPSVLNNRGVSLAQMGRFGAARNSFREALDLDPEYAAAQNNLSKLRGRFK
jgi:tetratricopeptide (TPR) repeat protein